MKNDKDTNTAKDQGDSTSVSLSGSHKAQRGQINCFECKHFYITWEPTSPKGCRVYGFKSYDLPSFVVARSSGGPCLGFERKK